jgi:DNA-binding XRE family transcriptional regulator
MLAFGQENHMPIAACLEANRTTVVAIENDKKIANAVRIDIVRKRIFSATLWSIQM